MDLTEYKSNVLHELNRLRRLAEAAASQLDDKEFFETIGENGNCVAVIMKHMSGNMRSRWRYFLTTDGEKSDRNRDSEFEISANDTKSSILESWHAGWRMILDTIGSLSPSDFDVTVFIRREPHTVVQAINRQLTHTPTMLARLSSWQSRFVVQSGVVLAFLAVNHRSSMAVPQST